ASRRRRKAAPISRRTSPATPPTCTWCSLRSASSSSPTSRACSENRMADVMVIVSKAVFEKAAGKHPKLGGRLRMDRYGTANKALEPVGGGGKLYLVTVRPPDEKLWLVAVLEDPKFDGTQWIAEACDTPMTDISALRSKIKFESGKGISAAAGTLGMS